LDEVALKEWNSFTPNLIFDRIAAGRPAKIIPLPENASFSIRVSFESDANETYLSNLQFAKHDSQITETEAGRSIEARPVPQNACLSNRANCEFAAKEIDASD
jgi:hypothetical protein